MPYQTIIYEKTDNIARVILNREGGMHPLNNQLREDIMTACREIAEDDEIRAVILTGAGEKAFSVGADIKEFGSRPSMVEFLAQRQRFAVQSAVAQLPQPVIAAINGYALGGGLELAMACDLRIACEEATLGLPEINLAIIPGGGGTQRLPRLVGKGVALELILTGRHISAQEALRIGLVNKVVPRASLMAEAETVARALAAKAPIALRYAKEAIHKGLDMTLEQGVRLEADLSMILQTTEDRREGIRAFLEKRPPQFKGR